MGQGQFGRLLDRRPAVDGYSKHGAMSSLTWTVVTGILSVVRHQSTYAIRMATLVSRN